jgi:hypothetical protein
MTQKITALIVLAVFSPSAIWFPSDAVAQQKSMKDQLVGAWTLVSISDDSRSRDKPLQPSGKYIIRFEPGGRVTSTFTGTMTITEPGGHPRTADRTTAVSGTYSVNEAEHSVTYQIGSLLLLGTDPKTAVTMNGKQFEQVSHPVGSSAATRTVWQRVN